MGVSKSTQTHEGIVTCGAIHLFGIKQAKKDGIIKFVASTQDSWSKTTKRIGEKFQQFP